MSTRVGTWMLSHPYRASVPLFSILIVMGAIAWKPDESHRGTIWLGLLLLMTAFAVVAGKAVTGYWRGLLIDDRNRLSLSRLQMLAWTVLILSALLVSVSSNAALGHESPLSVDVPTPLWILMGITTTTLAAAPAIQGAKRELKAERNASKRGLAAAQKVAHNSQPEGLLIRNLSPADAQWGDLLRGDELANAAVLDMAKLQLLLFTFMLVVGYGAAISSMPSAEGPVLSLPPADEGVNVLLGISHTGYLSSKVIPRTQQATKKPTPEAQDG